MIGVSDCLSQTRNKDNSWADEESIIWTFKYIQNGMAVQDETLKPDNKHSGSLRQYSVDSARWYVHYYSNPPSASLSIWEGNLKEDKIILYNEQKAPNGTEGFYKITFSEISASGFNWLGEWVNKNESFKLPTWKITCKKRKE